MFCPKCGNELDNTAKFCPKCGQLVHVTGEESDSVSNRSESFVLTVNRAKQLFAVNPAVNIIVDGIATYKIENATTVNIPISKGNHNVEFSCSVRNKVINVNVQSNITINIKWSRITGGIVVE